MGKLYRPFEDARQRRRSLAIDLLLVGLIIAGFFLFSFFAARRPAEDLRALSTEVLP